MKNKYWDKVRAKRLVSHLEKIDVNKWVNSNDLEKICNIKDITTSHERKIRVLIKNTVKQFSVPIVSGGTKGYKIALVQEDIDQYEKRMHSTINGILEGIEDVKLAFDLYQKGHVVKFSDLIDTSKPKRLVLKIKNKSTSTHSFVN